MKLKRFIEKILINTEESYQTGFEKKEKFIRALLKRTNFVQRRVGSQRMGVGLVQKEYFNTN